MRANWSVGDIPDNARRTQSFYGSIRKNHSEQTLLGMGNLARSSFDDLPHIALAGLASRVSISGSTSASQQDLQHFFASRTSSFASFRAPERPPLLVPDVVIEGGVTIPLVLSTAGALLSSFQFGFNNGNMNTPAKVIRTAIGIPPHAPENCHDLSKADLDRSNLIWGFIVSVFCLSALVGSSMAGRVADQVGRRNFFAANSLIYLVAALIGAAATLPSCTHASSSCDIEPCIPAILLIITSRVIAGLSCGGSTVVVPMYLGEIAPAHLRGTLGSAFLLTAVTAMLVAQVIGLPEMFGTPSHWWLSLGFVALPALLQMLVLHPHTLESPRWLLIMRRTDEAHDVLATLRGCSEQDTLELTEELASMIAATLPADRSTGLKALREPMLGKHKSTSESVQLLITDRTAWKPLLMVIPLMAIQQFSGINNAFNYSSSFLEDSGVSESMITLIAVSMNVGNVLVVLLSTVLMDRLGRKPLLAGSMVFMASSCALLTLALLVQSVVLVCIAMVAFVMSFGLGLGPVIWLLPAELFPMHQRAAATSLATATNWLANFIVGQSFPILASALGPFSFLPFGGVLLFGLLILRNVPETRGRTLEQIERMLKER